MFREHYSYIHTHPIDSLENSLSGIRKTFHNLNIFYFATPKPFGEHNKLSN